MKSTYELVKFRNSKDPEFLKALKLYSEHIEAVYRTDSKEIMYWAENYNKKYNDSFFALGFYLNNILIGFSELAYFIEERIVVVDYLVIDKNYRKNNTFYEFINHIEEFLSKENIVLDYILCEVGCYFENAEPPESSRSLIRLLKISGFGVIKSKYFVPRLGLTNYESEMIAVLMIYTHDKIKQIKTDTFLTIVNTIYFKYYFRWYKIFLKDEEIDKYRSLLETLLLKVKKNLGNKDIIEINGYNNILSPNTGDFRVSKFKKGVKLITFIILTIICLLGIGSLAFYIQKNFGIDINSQTSIFTLSLILVILISSLIFENKSNFFSNLLEKFIDKL